MVIRPTPKTFPGRLPARKGLCGVLGELSPDRMTIVIREEIIDQILDYSEETPGRETGGFLLGGWHVDSQLAAPREFLEIRHFLPASATRSRVASLTFTHETWAELNRTVNQDYPDERVLGWHHTHPGLGVFFSEYDRFIQANFFPHPWQVAMVVDPVRNEFAFFQWRGEHFETSGFVCVKQATSERDFVNG